MDGKTLLRQARELLQESGTSSFLDDKTTYDWIYRAACEYAFRTRLLTTSTTVVTVQGIRTYALPIDYLRLYAKHNREDRYFIKINDGVSDSFVYDRDYGSVLHENNSSQSAIASSFSLVDATPATPLSGAVTSDGAVNSPFTGECYLNDAAGAFLTTVAVGDYVHNSKTDCSGVVIAVTSNAQLTCAIFDNAAGTAAGFASGDTYVINQQGRFAIYLDPPPLTTGYAISVPYIRRPAPVYSPYRAYQFPGDPSMALISYAAWAYKYRDREPNFGDALFQHFDRAIRAGTLATNRALTRRNFRVNLIKRGTSSGSWR